MVILLFAVQPATSVLAVGTADVRAGADGFHVNGRLMFPASRLRGARVVRVQDGHALVLDTRHFTHFEVAVPDEATGIAMLHAMNLGADKHALTFLGSVVTASSHLILLRALIGAPLVVAWLAAGGIRCVAADHRYLLAASAIAFALARVVFDRSIRVGGDGIHVASRWLKRRGRLIPHADIEKVSCLRQAEGTHVLALRLRGGGTLRLASADAEDIATRIRDARVSAQARATSPEVAKLVHETDPDAWVKALTAMANDGSVYRTDTLTAATLFDVLEDANAPVEQRAAAAFVLRLRVRTEALPRIRVIAAGVADPEVRDALERIGGDSDNVSTEALRQLRLTSRT